MRPGEVVQSPPPCRTPIPVVVRTQSPWHLAPAAPTRNFPHIITRVLAGLLVLASASLFAPARAAQCGGDFGTFLANMGREAQAAGVSRATIDQAFAGVTIDEGVLSFDRRQRGTFRKSFE